MARILISLVIFILSLVMMTILCTAVWDAFINNKIYNCTDGGSWDFLDPGKWVHNPVSVLKVTGGRSMSEPDQIKSGWSVVGLWSVWLCLVCVSLIVSSSIALQCLPRQIPRSGSV